MVQISNGIWNMDVQPLESGQMTAILYKTIWNPDKNVWISDGWDHSFSPTIWNPTFKKLGIQMVGFQIPTLIYIR